MAEQRECDARKGVRVMFEELLQATGMHVEREQVEREEYTIHFVKIRARFEDLEIAAERLRLEMPVRGLEEDEPTHLCCTPLYEWLTTDNERDIIATTYNRAYRDIFVGADDPELFFRPCMRQMLVWDIITRINIVPRTDAELKAGRTNKLLTEILSSHTGFGGLLLLLHKSVYRDAFVPHDPVAPDGSDPRSEIAASFTSWLKLV